MFKKFAETVLLFKWPIFLALMLITLTTGFALFRLQIDPSVETLFNKRSPEYQYYRKFTERYGSDQMVAIALSTDNLFQTQNLKMLKDLTDALEGFHGVERVISLANVKDIRHRFLGVKIVPAMNDVLRGKQSMEEFRQSVMDNELYLNSLISPDGRIANIVVFLRSSRDPGISHGVLVSKLEKILEKFDGPGHHFFMAGGPIEQYEFVRLIRRDQMIFVPMITLLLVVTTFLFYQSFACIILSMAIVLMSLIWTLGTISLLGQEMNLVTSLLTPVIMIVAVANSIHLMNLFFEIRPHHSSLRRSVVLTIHQLGVPSLLTHLTTVCGFASLALNPVPAIQSFGLFAALGTFYSYVIEMLLTPILLPTLPYREKNDSFDEGHFINRVLIGFLEKFEFRWKWVILGITGVVLVLSIVGISRIEVDTNLVKQMKEDSRLAVATRFIDEHLTGVYTLGFVMRGKNGTDILDHNMLVAIDKFKDYLESIPEITNVNSITTIIKKIHQAREGNPESYKIPEDNDTIRRYLRGVMESEDSPMKALLSSDLDEIRLEARMKAVGTKEGAAIEANVRRYLATNLKPIIDYRLTGNIVLLGQMAQDLIQNQILGFKLAFLSITLLIIIFMRSVRMGLLAAIPNLLPILAVYGFMGFLSVELSTPTAMISSVVLGMVVDASIHFLHRFRLEFRKRHHYIQALHHTYRNVGQALIISSSILIAGFASSMFASFRPTMFFGVLTSLTIFFALICTLMILPVCLVLLKPFGPQRLFKRDRAE